MPGQHLQDPPTLFGGALGADKSPLRMRALVALCFWAGTLGILGVGVGLWVMVRLMTYGTPFWYEPAIVLTGVAGVGLVVTSFVTADKGYLPWALMGASTLVLLLAIGLTSLAG